MKHGQEQQRPRGLRAFGDCAGLESRPRAASLSASLGGDDLDATSDLSFGPPARMLRHRSVDSVQASVEVHRSTSGRNLRLRQISQTTLDAVSSPMALTPRAPPGKRPPAGRRPRWERSGRDDEAEGNNATEPDGGDCEGNNSDAADEPKRACPSQERRSSFSISPNALKELVRLQQIEQAAAMLRIDESREGSSDRSDDSAGLDIEGDQNNHEDDGRGEELEAEDSTYTQQEPRSGFVRQEKPVYDFPLWNRAKQNVRLPQALVNVDRGEENNRTESVDKDTDRPPRRASRESDSIQVAVEMVSMLHVDRTAFVRTRGDGVGEDAAPLSLTRSVSPRISIATSSFFFETSSLPLPDRPARLSVASKPTLTPSRVANPITKWKRGEMIGSGTFGKVYVGLNGETGELFALKEIEIRAMPSADTVKQMHKLEEEIALMKNLSHKHIVQYKGSHRTDTHFCIFMEYVPGGSIARLLKQFDAFGEDLIRIFARQIVEGVVYLHSVGVVHRDIKGANVLVNEQGVSKLADFGCSKQIPQLLTTSLEESLRSIRGSIPWMAPEVVKQERHGYKADIWSIGATVVEMATAKHPWPSCSSGVAAMYAIATAKVSPPPPDHLSPDAKAFLSRCFCIDPEERATAQELLRHPFLAEQ